MTPELEKQIKADNGYRTSPRMCQLCRFMQAENGIRSCGVAVVYYCTLPEPEGRFTVYERGCCDKFEDKWSITQAGPTPEEFF